MSLMLSRMMTTFTLMFALAFGVCAIRILHTDNTEFAFDASYVELLDTGKMKAAADSVAIAAPEMTFEEIKLPVERKVAVSRPRPVKKIEVKVQEKILPETIVKVSPNELPFQEPVELKKIEFNGQLLENMVALYEGLPVQEKVLVAEALVKDEVKTIQSTDKEVSPEAEPEFFEYEKKEEVIEVAAEAPAPKEAVETVQVTVNGPAAAQASAPQSPEAKEVDQDVNLVAFDYSGMQQDIRNNKVPTISMVDTKPRKGKPSQRVTTQDDRPPVQEETHKSAFLAPSFESQMTIQGVASDLKGTQGLEGFEVRFQDNSAEAHEDYGDGEVTVTYPMARQKMTRSMVLLKRGYAPTNMDLILEDGAGSVSVPALPQELADELLQPYESKGAVGLLLVELADETEKATLDVPFEKVITLDGDMKETSSEDFRYQLFVGVKAGNALLTYVHGHEFTNKIIHIHERELTYESNFFEKENLTKISLFQEDLLSREKSPLITASENVKVFAKNIHGEKLNQNTYRMNFGKALLGGRNYLELTHESEPVFVGTRNESTISVPSESFMRHILSGLPEKSLGNRCLIQVNLKKKIAEVEVAAESVGESLMAMAQFLDADGKFYETASAKTRKIIVYGENQGSEDITGKVNLKIQYVDGSYDFLGTYCSPNSYLVEQL